MVLENDRIEDLPHLYGYTSAVANSGHQRIPGTYGEWASVGVV